MHINNRDILFNKVCVPPNYRWFFFHDRCYNLVLYYTEIPKIIVGIPAFFCRQQGNLSSDFVGEMSAWQQVSFTFKGLSWVAIGCVVSFLKIVLQWELKGSERDDIYLNWNPFEDWVGWLAHCVHNGRVFSALYCMTAGGFSWGFTTSPMQSVILFMNALDKLLHPILVYALFSGCSICSRQRSSSMLLVPASTCFRLNFFEKIENFFSSN